VSEFKLGVARRALNADKIINVPVLKTHTQCKISLHLKNPKGCLDRRSKMLCHNPEGHLERMFSRIVEQPPVELTRRKSPCEAIVDRSGAQKDLHWRAMVIAGICALTRPLLFVGK